MWKLSSKRKPAGRANHCSFLPLPQKEEANTFFDGMEKFLANETMVPALKDSVAASLNRMKERCDDRYANEEHQMSTLLFQSELPGLLWPLLMHAAIKY